MRFPFLCWNVYTEPPAGKTISSLLLLLLHHFIFFCVFILQRRMSCVFVRAGLSLVTKTRQWKCFGYKVFIYAEGFVIYSCLFMNKLLLCPSFCCLLHNYTSLLHVFYFHFEHLFVNIWSIRHCVWKSWSNSINSTWLHMLSLNLVKKWIFPSKLDRNKLQDLVILCLRGTFIIKPSAGGRDLCRHKRLMVHRVGDRVHQTFKRRSSLVSTGRAMRRARLL